MRRRRTRVGETGYPPPLDMFDVMDWWVSDPGAREQVTEARIIWSVTREAYRNGDPDWRRFLQPPVWWEHLHKND